MLGNVGPKDLRHEALEGGVDRPDGVDVAHREVGRRLFRDERVHPVVGLFPDEDHQPEEHTLVRPQGGDEGLVPRLRPGSVQ